jgi:hypothetical protein
MASNTNARTSIASDTGGRVILVDPNDVIAESTGGNVNGTPPYEEMTPYVEMYCIRRKDNVITMGENGKYKLEAGGAATVVNLLNPDRIHQANTTLYTEDIVGVNNRIHNEGFGIESIDVSMNANYVPTVSVTFRDVRGTSLFMQGENSPLAAIFDFPPPVFKLRLKGAFGRFVEYDLHLVDHNGGSVDSSTGDYMLKCNFVGVYFGPLTDMLLGYIKAVPFLKGEDTSVGMQDTTTSQVNGEDTTVNSFFELIQRGDLLYSAVDTLKNNNGYSDEASLVSKEIEEIKDIKTRIQSFSDPGDTKLKQFLKEQGKEAWVSKIQVHSNPNELVYSFKTDKTPDSNFVVSGSTYVNPGKTVFDANTVTQLKALVKLFVETVFLKGFEADRKILGKGRATPTIINYRDTALVKLTEHTTQDGDYEYTVTYKGLLDKVNSVLATCALELRNLGEQINSSLKQVSRDILPIGPTIGNIFRVLCNDFDYMVGRIRQAGEQPKTLTGAGAGFTVNTGEIAWPYVEQKQIIQVPGNATGSGAQKEQLVQIYPGVNPEFRSWPEVQLVEEYVRSIPKQQKAERDYANFKLIIDPKNYIPLTPLESINPGDKLKIANPYYNKTKTFEELYTEILARYEVTKYFSYAEMFTIAEDTAYESNTSWLKGADLPNKEKRTALVKLNATLEAHNLWYVLQADSDAPVTKYMRETASSKTLAEILSYVANSTYSSLSKKGVVNPDFPFRGTTLHSRKSADFTGVLDIISSAEASAGKKALYSPQTGTDADPVAQDRKKILDENAANYLFDGESRKAIVSEAQSLLYPDALATKEEGKSDFINGDIHGLPDIGSIVIGISSHGVKLSTYAYNIYDIITIFVLLEDIATVRDFSQTDHAANKELFFKQLLASENFVIPNETSLASGFDDILAKFLSPGVVQMPRIYALYLGYYLSKHARPNWISPNDYLKFVSYYNDYSLTDLNKGASFISDMADLRKQLLDAKSIDSNGVILNRKQAYTQLNSITRKMNSLMDLVQPVYVVNASSMTFLREDKVTFNGVASLRDSNGAIREESTLQLYLDTFHKELAKMLTESTDKDTKIANEIDGKIKDNDFKSQIYYNFKAFYERWIVGTQKEFTKPGELYDRFKFVTRAHQNIADECIVDFSNFVEDAHNEEMSVFTSIGRLLQENKFMFFPLHSYMEFDGVNNSADEWSKSFQIDNRLNSDTLSKPSFVCMHMGGFSSRLKNAGKGYGDDGFTFGPEQPIDFSSGEGRLFAFRAKAGAQNQSIFSFPEWSMEEHKSTDVSLKMESQILDKPTDSRKIRKSQNLLSIYAQRSYTVGMSIPLGNMCIQPTQYFQLEGMPFLNGAYMVHQVSHTISAGSNRLETKFKGYRMGKYIHPIITESTMDYAGLDGETAATLSDASAGLQAAGYSSIVGGNVTDGIIRGLCLDKRFNYNYYLVKALIDTETAGKRGFSNGKMLINIAMNYARRYIKSVPAEYQDAYNRIPKSMPESQTKRHEYLDLLRRIDNTAALRATAMGMGQIMGDNYRVAGKLAGGYTSPQQMYDSFSQSEVLQLMGMFSFMDAASARGIKLRTVLQTPEGQVTPETLANIARIYNGGEPGYVARLTKLYNNAKSQPLPDPQPLTLESDGSLALARTAWLSQGSDSTGCFRTCQQMIGKKAPSNLGITVAQERNGSIVRTNTASRGIGVIDQHLARKQPIIVGVDHKPGSPNNDDTTDHFVVLVASGVDPQRGKYYRFYDPGTGHQDLGTSASNLLFENPNTGLFTGTSAYNATRKSYTLSWVRPTA